MINQEIIESLFLELSSQFYGAFKNGEDASADALATPFPMHTKTVDFQWLGDLPDFREWIGERIVKELSNFRYTATYKEYELTLGVKMMDILDNVLSHYSLQSFAGGEEARLLRPKLIAAAYDGGDALPCYDGQNYFDASHPVGNDGDTTTASNFLNAGGASIASPWYVADLSRVVKPVLFLSRLAPMFQQFTSMETSEYVFKNKKFLFGSNAAYGTAYGLWQTCVRNEGAMTVQELMDTVDHMKDFRSDTKDEQGRRKKLGINPTHLIVARGSSNARKAQAIINSAQIAGTYTSNPVAPGASDTLKQNPMFSSLQIIESSWLP